MSQEADYYLVTLNEDDTLSCKCNEFKQTGKTCEHTFAVNLQRKYGSVERYNDLETIRKVRGKAAKGQKNNPPVKTTGRQQQRRTDHTVSKDHDRYLEQVEKKVNPWRLDDSSDSPDDTSDKPLLLALPSSFRFLDLALRARFPHAPLITIVIIVLALRPFAVDVQSLPSIFRRFEVCSDSLWSFHSLVPTSRTSFAWSEWPDRRCRSYERHSDGSLPAMRRCCAAPSSLVADASIKIPHDASSPPSRPSLREQHAAYLEPLSRHFSTLGQRSSFDLVVTQRARHGDRSGDPDDTHGVPVATLTPSTMWQRQPRRSQRPRASTAAPLPVTSLAALHPWRCNNRHDIAARSLLRAARTSAARRARRITARASVLAASPPPSCGFV
ncbi:hypothetical protein B0H15DRAFT_966321 [Mycena belliarum]|uniref:SWIM-type domain-containing protein n=1 Tax=Mycena belliarum TaxID=1033014 RepID=A0AAD6XI76_9AGAR|nr:hypothetical protein B0H15DRAFT_966321 [Mycena belliae]